MILKRTGSGVLGQDRLGALPHPFKHWTRSAAFRVSPIFSRI